MYWSPVGASASVFFWFYGALVKSIERPPTYFEGFFNVLFFKVGIFACRMNRWFVFLARVARCC